MRTVDYNSLRDVKQIKTSGSFANVFITSVMGKTYFYKQFKRVLDNHIISNIANLTEEEFPKQYLTPLYLVEKIGRGRFPGCLSEYLENGQDIIFICEEDKQIKYLNQAKKLVTDFHTVFGYIHGDISNSNILVDVDEDLCYLADFDSSLRKGQEVKSYMSFSREVCNYLKYYKFDEKVDIYKFNLMSLSILCNMYEEEILKSIAYNEFRYMEENKDVKRLCKELVFDDIRKPISGEFIVDYIAR